MALITLIVSLMVKELFIPIGKQFKAAMLGILAVASLIVGMGAIIIAIGYLLKIKGMKKAMIQGAAVVLGIAAIAIVAAKAAQEFIELAQMMNSVTAKDVALAAGVVVGVIAGMGLIIGGVGLLMKIPGLKKVMVEGAIVVAGIEAIAWLCFEVTDKFADLCIKLQSVTAEDVAFAGLIVAGVLAAMGVIITAVGALMTCTMGIGAAILASGAAAVAGISATTMVAVEAALQLANATPDILKANKNQKWSDSCQIAIAIGIIEGTLEGMGDLIEEIGDNSSWSNRMAFEAVLGIMDDVRIFIKKVVDLIDFMNTKKITQDVVTNFLTIIKGPEAGKISEESLFGSIKVIMDAMADFCTLGKTIKLHIVMDLIDRLFKTISKFIDMVAKVAQLTYINGYDDNGKPTFGKIKPEEFGQAAHTVTDEFKYFITEMTNGFGELDIYGAILIDIICHFMDPVLDTVGKFIDVIGKLCTMNVVIGYDDNGNPEYRKVNEKDFETAATTVTDRFKYFVEQMTRGFGFLDILGGILIETICDSMNPVLDTVGKFVDIIGKLCTMTVVTGYDDNGNPEYGDPITDKQFGDAATTVTDKFTYFVTELIKCTKQMNFWTAQAIEDLGNALMPVMSSVGSFVDAIIKMAGGTYISGYDEKGNPELTEIEDDDMILAAITIVTCFTLFAEKMVELTKAGSWFNSINGDVIKEFGEGMGPVMSSVGSFVDGIIKMAAGTFISGYDENGNPVFTHITHDEMQNAANDIVNYFGQFV